jgi:adenine/guanine phosphoribosyltransferase-like PRPP-binding protein
VTVPWDGQWVAERLPAELITDRPGGLALDDLVGLALRVNPRRAHLLVSHVLGKHIPVDPRLAYGAGRLLGALVADALRGIDTGIGPAGAALLTDAVSGRPAAADELLSACAKHTAELEPGAAIVLGYAETATGLGHCVADALRASYLHSTRRPVDGRPPVGAFEEEHSHATDHLLLPQSPGFLAGAEPLVLVDDELSTGRTVLNTIRVLQQEFPRERYIVATLVDLRSPGDRDRMSAAAAEWGIQLDVVALATGTVGLGPDVLSAGARLVAQHRSDLIAPADPIVPVSYPSGPEWPTGVRDGARHGFTEADRAGFDAAISQVGECLARELGTAANRRRVLVLGSEELMYLPLRLALELGNRLGPDVDVLFSTTTRSPILPVDEPGYAIRTALRFAAHDRPADGAGARYAYNVAPPTGGATFDQVIFVVDDASTAWEEADDGPLEQLAAVAGAVRLVVVPSHRPAPLPTPLRGPAFGSYAPDEVAWLLTDLSGVALEAPVEEREEAIQAGRAHYAESLPIEFQPTVEYQELYAAALAESAPVVARAVGLVTELVLAERGSRIALASLARAGTPVGILMRRWARYAHGLDLPHYAVSIVRGRGIDEVALEYLAAHHDPADVVFVDGWTGKGAIARELAAAIEAVNGHGRFPGRFVGDLAVLADTGHCVAQYGTRADFLIPSACLNSTVSGLISRTVLNRAILRSNQFHGAKYYAELVAADVSVAFLDAISAQFPAVAGEVAARLPALVAADRAPTWAGWASVQRLAARYGVPDVNLVKPGVGETTRVLLRRVPWKVLMRSDAVARLGHVAMLARQRGVDVEILDDMTYSCVGLIHPEYARAGTGEG